MRHMTSPNKKKTGRVTPPSARNQRKPRARKAWTMDEIEETKVLMSDVVRLPLVPSIAIAFDKARKAVEVAERRFLLDSNAETERALSEAQEEFDRLDEEFYETSVEFEMVGLGRKKVEDLVRLHRPTPEQVKEYQENLKMMGRPVSSDPLTYNSDSFPPALIARCVAYPEMSEEEAIRMWNSDKWGRAELAALFGSALALSNMMT